MPRQSVLEYFQPESRSASDVAISWRRGYRMERWTYARLIETSQNFAAELDRRKIDAGSRVMLWGENSGEWVAAFLGCIARGVVAVPMDAIAVPEFAARVAQQTNARLIVTSHDPGEIAPGAASMRFEDLRALPAVSGAGPLAVRAPQRTDVVEIVFTSGTTAEPRGVVLTHGNLLANLEPIEAGFQKYRRYERIVHPLRILNLLPLSHVFGQMLGIFIPPILNATAVFLDSLRPGDVVQTIRREKINVLATVPRIIESLRDKVECDLESEGRLERFRRKFRTSERRHYLMRWWIFRRIHRQFGWGFWAIVSGGAALPQRAEEFWNRVGYAVIQGYGLTETTSMVSLNDPFHPGRGSIGKTLPGRELKLSADGEILVRGESIASGYSRTDSLEQVAGEDGWFRTGDRGEMDAEGNLFFKGRQKNVIVTAEGMNIHPEDLEAALQRQPEVRDCVVIGIERDGNAEPCAVLLLRSPLANAAAVVDKANQMLASFQQMRRWQVWSGEDFPRTPTQKPLLPKIRAVVEREIADKPASDANRGPHDVLTQWINRRMHSSGAAISSQARLSADLNLSSLDRVELLSILEDRYQVDLNESSVAEATTVGELEALLRQPPPAAVAYPFPRWPRRWPVPWVREAAYYLLMCPAALILGWPRTTGRENLRGLHGPALFISNHVTPIDAGILLPSLPARFRRRMAIAMGGERLRSMRHPGPTVNIFVRIYAQVQYVLVAALMNVFALPQRTGFRQSFSFAGELADGGSSILIFPEGATTLDGKIAPFRVGVGLLASRLGIPVVPMRIDGLFELRQRGKRTARPGQIHVTIGAPIHFEAEDTPERITGVLEQRVAELR
jgi:long-chain acyl-CoA synthetase